MKRISNPTYVLRTCNKNLQDYNGFQWPKKGFVEASNWNPEPICGGGLHGLLMGKGSENLLNWDDEAIWQVVKVQEDTVVWIGEDQVKFPYGNVVYSGNRKDATDLIISLGADPKDVPGEYQIGGDDAKLIGGNRSILQGDDGSTLTGGDGSILQGGFESTLQGGERSTLTGGKFSTLRGGDYSTLTGGYMSNLTGGYMSNLTGGTFSTLTGGKGSTLQGGEGSTVQGGDGSTLTGGKGSTLQGGNDSTLQGGYWSTLTGGEGSTLTGGYGSKFKAGKNSCFIGSFFKGRRKQVITVYVGEDGIKADTWYRFENRVFTEVVDK